MDEPKSIIRIKEITFGYPGHPRVLNKLDLEIYKGDRIGLVAPNGSGKTTLFHIILGLLKPESGHMEIFGKPVCGEKDFLDVRRRIGFLFQDADDQLFNPTVLEDVAFGPLNLGKSKKEAIAISKRTLQFLGLTGFENRINFKLSGGEKKLVSLATVLAMEPEVLLLDEPITGLDDRTIATLIDVLKNLDITYMLISHDMDFLANTTTKIYTMLNGKVFMDKEVQLHQHVHIHRLGDTPHGHE
jgi:cobalt/nickel transport system ATP-binding protein